MASHGNGGRKTDGKGQRRGSKGYDKREIRVCIQQKKRGLSAATMKCDNATMWELLSTHPSYSMASFCPFLYCNQSMPPAGIQDRTDIHAFNRPTPNKQTCHFCSLLSHCARFPTLDWLNSHSIGSRKAYLRIDTVHTVCSID